MAEPRTFDPPLHSWHCCLEQICFQLFTIFFFLCVCVCLISEVCDQTWFLGTPSQVFYGLGLSYCCFLLSGVSLVEGARGLMKLRRQETWKMPKAHKSQAFWETSERVHLSRPGWGWGQGLGLKVSVHRHLPGFFSWRNWSYPSQGCVHRLWHTWYILDETPAENIKIIESTWVRRCSP